MKRILMICVAIAATMSFANAQTLQNSKLSDNWFIGIDGGAYTPMSHTAFFKGMRAVTGIKVGRYISPVFGMRLDGQFYINPNQHGSAPKTAIDMSNVSLDGLFNLSNLFGGYQGEPRACELVGVFGSGWGHAFGTGGDAADINVFTVKTGAQLNFNLGASKAWQINIEPDVVWLNTHNRGDDYLSKSSAMFQILGGITYKFACSNGTHNFAIAKLFDQGEINELNAKINDLRKSNGEKDDALRAADAKNAELARKLADCEATPKSVVKQTETNLAPVVIFDQGKSVIKPAQAPSVQMIATYMKNHPDAKVTIKGYASPEGSAEINKKLSEARANAVKDMLVKKYKISEDRLSVVGLGATNEVFDESDWNRVCVFVEK